MKQTSEGGGFIPEHVSAWRMDMTRLCRPGVGLGHHGRGLVRAEFVLTHRFKVVLVCKLVKNTSNEKEEEAGFEPSRVVYFPMVSTRASTPRGCTSTSTRSAPSTASTCTSSTWRVKDRRWMSTRIKTCRCLTFSALSFRSFQQWDYFYSIFVCFGKFV